MAKEEYVGEKMLDPRADYHLPLDKGEEGVCATVNTETSAQGIQQVSSNMSRDTQTDNTPANPNK